MEKLELAPMGFQEPDWWSITRWIMVKTTIMNGRIKWRTKKRFRVAFEIANPPHTH